jgi:hypothetical protein
MPLSPITLVFSGLTILMVGVAWVGIAASGRGKGGWRTALSLAVVFAAGSAALSSVDASLALGAAALAAASLLMAVMRTDFPAWLAKAMARPLPQATLVVLGGLGLVVYGMYRIDADLKKDLNDSAKAVNAAAASVDLNPSSVPAARTDLGRPIPLWVPSADSVESLQSFSEKDYLGRMQLNARLIQTGAMDGDYNCHGWVFTGGKFWVRGGWVETILRDNGYREALRPMIGDLCVYRDDKGEVSHTAIVRGLGADGLILLESKWGKLGRYIHNANADHAYRGHTPKYYRTKRGTHLLAGIENVKPEMLSGPAEEEE